LDTANKPAEWKRLNEVDNVKWKKWGSYLSEREWGNVREDYSKDGSAWQYLPHDHARSRTYRWGEDGIAGISDNNQILCFALAFWNGSDPILKERLFGLTNKEGNHGEDVKELYYYLDNTPTHSYMKYLYKYPQEAFPYQDLVEVNTNRDKGQPEFELMDAGIFDEDRYFDVFVEYAKNDPEDILIKITAENRGPDASELSLLPTLWFRNTWKWSGSDKPAEISVNDNGEHAFLRAEHSDFGTYRLYFESEDDHPELLCTENETNEKRLFGAPGNATKYVKDGINDYIVDGKETINPEQIGTKASLKYQKTVPAGESVQIRLRLTKQKSEPDFGKAFDKIVDKRRAEADAFYEHIATEDLSDEMYDIQRQALSGLLWNKQFYHYNVRKWLLGDPAEPSPPEQRKKGRNSGWIHLDNKDILSMPDKWEYPWYASWDLAFHCISLALIDADFAKNQLLTLLHEWYMHPNGQIPSYEWTLSDTTPPVHAWAALRVYRIEKKIKGEGDDEFLKQVFHKLLINFTWWVNKKDINNRNVFQGGFLGMDNIGIFNRSDSLPAEGHLDQSDGTSWMAMFCLNMLSIALELADQDKTYEDLATKFLEHFFYIAHAINERGEVSLEGQDDIDLWDEEDEFYYDVLHLESGEKIPLKIHSMVGLIPLLAVTTIDAKHLEQLPKFKERMDWFLEHRPDLTKNIASVTKTGTGERRLFSVVNRDRLQSILRRMLDEAEFLSPYGIRSLSKYHDENPYSLKLGDTIYTIRYTPAESRTEMYGGNSNWRGPVWFPLNYLLIESLQKFDYYYGDEFKIEFPSGSDQKLNLWDISGKLSKRLIKLFLKDDDGNRPIYGDDEKMQSDPHFRDYFLFYEYFNGENGCGLGASHQTGWTALVAKLIQQSQQKSVASKSSESDRS